MSTIHEHLQSFHDDHITPTRQQERQARASQQSLRDIVAAAHAEDPTFLRLIDGEFIAGSFARATKPKPLDDVDLYLVLDGTDLVATDNGVPLGPVVRGSGVASSPFLGSTYNGPSGGISSIAILNRLREVLAESYPRSEIRRDGQVVNVWLDSYGLGIDVVPTFHILPPGAQDRYYIPIGHGNHAWMATNPKLDTQTMDVHDTYHGGFLRPVVKLVKHWSKERGRTGLKSYHLEVMIRTALASSVVASPLAGLAAAFKGVGNLVRSSCPDPTGFGAPLDGYLDNPSRDRIASSMAAAGATLDLANLYSLLGSHEAATREMRTIFGDRFGSQP